jgi:hypothetical protein
MSKNETIQGAYFGFDGLNDFVQHLLGLRTWVANFVIALVAVTTTFITNYVWDDSSAIYTLWGLMMLDWTIGVYNATVSKTFSSRRFPRMIVYLFLTSCMIAISWWLSKSSALFYFLPALIYGGFCSVYFISLVENFAVLGVLPKSFEKLIHKYFGLKALDKKISEALKDKK